MAEGDYGALLLVDEALDDPLHRWLKGSRIKEALEGLSWAPEVWVDLLTDCAPWRIFDAYIYLYVRYNYV